MRRMVEKMMNCYGRDMTVERGDASFRVRGFFQPVTGNRDRLAAPEMGALGLESGERYCYIGPVEPEALVGDGVAVDGKRFRVRSAQVIWGNGQPVYCWALCVEKGREDQWGSSG